MAELVADCSRCGSTKITFDLTQENLVGVKYNWQRWYEAFCVCRNCHRGSIFLLAQDAHSDRDIVHENGLVKLKGSVNRLMRVEGLISKKDEASVKPPEHLPAPIEAAFREGVESRAKLSH